MPSAIDFDTSSIVDFEPITLEEIIASDVGLLNRVDTKFILTHNEAFSIMSGLLDNGKYRVLEISGKRKLRYESLYYDTKHHDLYYQHYKNKSLRYKIRKRCYVDTQTYFLEVKRKEHMMTYKDRVAIQKENNPLDRCKAFIEKYTANTVDVTNILPTILSVYDRISFVNTTQNERITFDTNIFFENQRTYNVHSTDNICIVELKQKHIDRRAFCFQLMRQKNIKMFRISKYCIGLCMTDNSLKQNLFKAKKQYVLLKSKNAL